MAEFPLARDFPQAELADWQALVAEALKGAPLTSLRSTTYDGIVIEPLYARAKDANVIPGRVPGEPWAVMQRIDLPDPAAANTQVLDDLNNALYAKVPYDPYKDFIPLTMVGDIANTLIIHPSVPAASVKELVTAMKANPGKYNNFAHAGVGTTPHLSGELFRLTTGVDMVHVPFAGAGPAIQSTVAGHTPIMFTTLAPAVPQVKAGKLRALAVMAKTRSPALPDVPTMEQAGFKDQEANTFVAALLPAGTPKRIVDLVYGEIIAALKQPDVRARLASIGIDAVGNSSEEFSAQIKAEIAKWGKVIKDAKIGVN
jgi:tripartite-type tricarboxylate transporter receptor subunit TctC